MHGGTDVMPQDIDDVGQSGQGAFIQRDKNLILVFL